MVWTTFGLGWKLMSVFACVIFEEGELPEGGIWGKQRLPVLLGGNQPKPNQSNYLDAQTSAFINIAGVFGLTFCAWISKCDWPILIYFLSMSVKSVSSFPPPQWPKNGQTFLKRAHRRAGGCSGHHYGLLCRVTHSIRKQKAISPALKMPVMEVKWPVLLLLGKLNGWLYIVMLSVSADRQT